MKLGENVHLNVEAITGCLSLDIMLGVGGVPRGRIVEIFRSRVVGKTTVACIYSRGPKGGGEVAFIDAEHALDPSYAKKLKLMWKALCVTA